MRDLESVLRLLAKWRSQALAQTYVAQHGRRIRSGLFEGMEYAVEAAEGSLCARLFGTYESCLHPHLLQMHQEGLDCVVDVGCAEGFYAVGLARRFPELTVYAYDIDPFAREACAKLADVNGVADRVIIGELFQAEDFQAFAGRRVLVMVDAEGAELEVLRPDVAPALSDMKLIVETHDVWRPGALAEITRRFMPTHSIVRVDRSATLAEAELPDWLRDLSELDQMIAQWEWRHRSTPWLVMRPLSPTAIGNP
jgi:SAM-dependent methyltransferase